MKHLPTWCVSLALLTGTTASAQRFKQPSFERFRQAFPDNTSGSRVNFGDVDGDGDPDLLLSGKLYLNDGRGRFRLAPKAANMRARARAAVFADFDHDGDLDVFLSGTANGRDQMMRNVSTAQQVKFVKANRFFGIRDDGYPGEGVAAGDLNGDGRPDIYIANYEQSSLGGKTRDRLYLSGRDGKFRNESNFVDNHKKAGRGVQIVDFDRDGDADIFVSNYRLDRNLLWVNQKKQTGAFNLREEAEWRDIEGDRSSGGSYGHTIGSAWGDLNGDGRLDLVSANLAHPQYLHFSDRSYVYLQRADGQFTKTTAGIKYEETHSDPTLFDADNDGDLDLYLTSIYGGRRSFLYRNRKREDKQFRFRDCTEAAGAKAWNSWGAAAADVDGDGDLDLVVCANGRPILFRNTLPPRHKSVRIRLRGRRSDTWGAGATVILLQSGGAPRQVRQVTLGHGTSSQSEPIVHFGVGRSAGPYKIRVRWPSGRVKTVTRKAGLHKLWEPRAN